jgi:putative hydrolase of the HAD superfamily
MKKWRAIVFDLDDTLYPERDYVLSGFRAVARWAEENNLAPAVAGYAQLRRLFEIGLRGAIFDHWVESLALPSINWVPQLVEVYRKHDPQITPSPAVPELLARLRSRYLLGLISDGYLAVQQKKLAALGLAPFFDAVVFSDEFGRDAWKPSPKPFEALLGKLGIRAEEAIYVADNTTKDFIGARGVGMRTVRLRSPQGLYRHLEPPSALHSAEFEMTELASLEDILNAVETPA